MTKTYDLAIIGAGPAGMAAALEASARRLNVVLIDEQPAPGGQIWRNVEHLAGSRRARLFGTAYERGAGIVAAFHNTPCLYLPETRLWHLEEAESGFTLFHSRHHQAHSFRARHVLLATGAQERPTPFPGWTVPGVMTLGAAQILLKTSRHLPMGKVWIAGSGPLVLLYAVQLLEAGGKLAGIIETGADVPFSKLAPLVLKALPQFGKLMKGLSWQVYLRRKGVAVHKGATLVRAEGEERLTHVLFQDLKGQTRRKAADALLLHQGLIPSIHIPRALHCELYWNPSAYCFQPKVDDWGESSVKGLYIAGDGASIAGAEAAEARGRIAALGILHASGRLPLSEAKALAQPFRRALDGELHLRPLLEALYPPHPAIIAPADETLVCRCEELTAGTIRNFARQGCTDPNHMKALTRCGMGPCQGRQCGHSISQLISEISALKMDEVGFLRVRPPLKPLSLAELAALNMQETER